MTSITAPYLRNLVSTAMGMKIGLYMLPDMYTPIPAIAVIPDSVHGDNYPPEDTVVSGIEVVIHKPRPKTKARLGGDVLKQRRWEIFVNRWDANGDLLDAAERLINEFQNQNLQFDSPIFPAYNLDAGVVPFCRLAVIENLVRVVDNGL